ncbi:HAMP domain-containing sensor histidine kinase [Clostridium sp. OS1-26]|uniref:HAMP domain-containing sensor histidine kinase n=1 Tax=Clostridium sp. OS1-26 TaxID=3070681 RepID=UPI0027DED6C5|nr:HAMP domain-containing sensor histidine kinase [Clostridium sp. OS1-26]WML34796.1 HAMP domain-containing sensor histidine kinase [Clostridium sp. OS1-26]
MQNNLIPAINKRKLITSETKKNNVFYFNVSGKRYAATIYPLESSNNLKKGYLLIYSDLDKSSKLTTIVNIMLLSIMLIAAIIALIISNNVSEKISRPISQLSKYASKIGERKYDMEPIKYNDDEIGQLAETMYSMTQKLSAYDNTMKTFMQNASHELRTPLMSIQGYAEGIKYGVVDDQNKAIDIVIEESKRLSQLVEDLLYLSKIDALQEEMNFERINTEDMIRSSIERVSGIAVKNEKVISFSSSENNIMLQGDEEKLIRAIINILGNSLRYSKKYIDVTLKKEGSKIIILLEDDGPGFDEKDITNIFDRFYKGKQGNYGLGLAITKSIIEKHSGSIVAENRIKGGACFKITLPSESD